MEHLYTPWRSTYVSGEKKTVVDCIFCAKLVGTDADEHIIARAEHVYTALNRYPYSAGHLMIIARDHVASPEDLPPAALTELMLVTNAALAALRAVYNPPAFNLGANLGMAAGAGVAEHFHLHIVPRWPGDANFMTVVGETRVIPEEPGETWRKLRAAWPSLPARQ
jgi:ATP adenylyltransferase